jgi:Mn2+/Fe2+ NRAMP family transporter
MTARKNPVGKNVKTGNGSSLLKRSFAILGPGLITGAPDDDPSGISIYSVAGAAYGYATLWIALLTFPLMVAIQLMCARLGMVTAALDGRQSPARETAFRSSIELALELMRRIDERWRIAK